MKKKTFQKLTVFAIAIPLIGFFTVTPIVQADVTSTTSNNLSSVLEQLIQLLTQQLQALEQQLAIQQAATSSISSVIITNSPNNSVTQSPQTTSATEAVFPDCTVEIQTSTMFTSSNYNVFFQATVVSPDRPTSGRQALTYQRHIL